MTSTRLRTTLAAICAAVLAALGVVAAPSAGAQQRNMVIFGDSVIADPSGPQWAAGKLGLDPRGSSSVTTWCPTSPTSWGKQAAARLGLPAWDYSCTGTVSIQKGRRLAGRARQTVQRHLPQ